VVEESEPKVRIQAADAQVQVNQAEGAEVAVRQADAEVKVMQTGEADVNIRAAQGQPDVRNVEGAAPRVAVEQARARVNVESYQADPKGNLASDNDRSAYREMIVAHPIAGLNVIDVIGMDVRSERGEDVGEIDNIGRRGDVVVAIVGVGGFLGLGEHMVALPIDRLQVRGDEIILPTISEQELKAMPEYDENEVILSNGRGRVADLLDL
jgi:hypothetical protein